MNETEQSQPEALLDARPKPFVFVLMPFDPRYDDVYQLGIKKACDNAGAYAQRLDDQIFQDNMLQRIYNQIAKADVIVADMTSRNPNVFYEVGYAHALGKMVVLLTQDSGDIPFDLKLFPHIIYGGKILDLIPQLETRVKCALAQTAGRGQPKLPVAVYFGSRPLIDNPTISVETDRIAEITCFRFALVCGNVDELNPITFKIAMWTSGALKLWTCHWGGSDGWQRGTEHPEGKTIFTCVDHISLLPSEWRTLTVVFNTDDSCLGLKRDTQENVILRISTQSGSYSYPFALRFG